MSVGVPRDFSLEASKTAKTPEMMHLGCLLVLAWGETTNRTIADGREWYSCRTIRCGSGSWQDCGAGLWNRRQAHGVLAVTGSIPLGGSPRLPRVTYRKEKQTEKWDLCSRSLEYEMEEKHNCYLMNETPN